MPADSIQAALDALPQGVLTTAVSMAILAGIKMIYDFMVKIIKPVFTNTFEKLRRLMRLRAIKRLRRNTSSPASYQALLAVFTATASAFFASIAVWYTVSLLFANSNEQFIAMGFPVFALELIAILKKAEVDEAKKRMNKKYKIPIQHIRHE